MLKPVLRRPGLSTSPDCSQAASWRADAWPCSNQPVLHTTDCASHAVLWKQGPFDQQFFHVHSMPLLCNSSVPQCSDTITTGRS